MTETESITNPASTEKRAHPWLRYAVLLALLLALVAWPEADAIVPRTADGSHPLCALYRRDSVLPVARARLAAGVLELRGLLGATDTRFLDEAEMERLDPAGHALSNLNTPDDLARIESLIAGKHGGSP